MKIYGLQKMTLLDFPEHVACTVFLGGCDFRCPFCHNFELATGVPAPQMEEAELLQFLSKRQGLLDGVAFTGGEPCLHKDLLELIPKIRDLGFPVKLDTNGYHPELLGKLIAEHLVDYVAMDVKNAPEKYAQTAGLSENQLDLSIIKESIHLLMTSGCDYEFRTTVVDELHDAEDFQHIGEMIQGARRYFLQGFTDRDTVPFAGFHSPSEEKMEQYATISRQYVPETQIRGM